MRNLFDEGDIRASSDRYLRNAIIAVLAYDRRATLWDAVRLLSVTEEGYAYRTRVGQHLRGLPEFKEIGDFFTEELRAQLRDAKSMTTSKLDAPVNKAARLLNSPSIKRVLQNTSLTVDFDRIIAGGEVLVVKGALGAVGTGNTSVLMQLLIGHARRRALTPAGRRERRAASGRGAEDRRGAAGHQPRLRADDGAQAIGRARDGGLLADRCPVDRPRGAPPARRALRPSRLLRHRLGGGRPGGAPTS